MPRHIDPDLEGRVLEAARKLLHKSGDKGLSMRVVAQMAGTNTPALYRRFPNREALLKALVESFQKEAYIAVEPARSVREFAESIVEYALRKPREYELLMSGLLGRATKSRPVFELFTQRCTKWLGGAAEDHRRLALALTALIHGTVMLLLAGNPFAASPEQMKMAYLRAVDVLVAEEARLAQP